MEVCELVMMTDNKQHESPGVIIKRIRIAKGISQRQLAIKAGKDPGYLSVLESDGSKGMTLDSARAFAKALDVSPSVFLRPNSSSETYISGDSQSAKTLDAIIRDLQLAYDHRENVEIPVLGSIPAGYPATVADNVLDYITVPRIALGKADVKGLFALRVSGDSLIGDGIVSGDTVVLEPTSDIIDGKIYALRKRDEVVLRHVYKENDHLRLESSNGEYKRLKARSVEIIGRVVFLPRWY